MAWADSESPSLEDFELLARDAFASLPARFRALAEGVVFLVQDFPDEDVIIGMDLENAFEILGLFQGPGLAGQDSGHPEQTMIFLFRRPILDYWAENRETLGAIGRHVVIHEIGHHFGLSDADMDTIEASVD